MPCLFVLFAAFAPRLMILMLWIARPNAISSIFDTFLLPLLGFVFLPFTTLMYILLYASGPNGIDGTDWLWLAIAVVLDLTNHGGAFTQRNQMPGMSSSGSASAGTVAAAPMASPAPAPAPTYTPPAAPVAPVAPAPQAPAPPLVPPVAPPAADAAPPSDEGLTGV